jgi:type IV pilus assembly protein PilC
MSKYTYILKDELGRKKEGTVFGANVVVATEKVKELKDDSQYIIAVREVQPKKYWIFNRPKLKLQEKIIFINSLSTMLKVGVVLTEALEIVVQQTRKPASRKMFEDILNMVKSGQSFSKSLAKYDYVFSEITVNMIATGEENGTMDEIMEYICMQMEKEYEMQKKVVSALIYPVVIMSITVMMALGIVVFIMPKITRIFSSFKIDLPLPTKLLIGFSDLLTKQTVWVILGTAGFIFLASFLIKFKPFRPFWHRLYLKIPVMGSIIRAANIARFARTFNSLLMSGTAMTKSMQILQNVFTNVVYRDALKKTAEIMEKGGKVGESLEQFPKQFPVLVTKMIYIGEKTGSLNVTTDRIAEMFEKDVDNKTKNLSVMLEPFLLVLMGLMVGGIALSIILPIYQLPNMINK